MSSFNTAGQTIQYSNCVADKDFAAMRNLKSLIKIIMKYSVI